MPPHLRVPIHRDLSLALHTALSTPLLIPHAHIRLRARIRRVMHAREAPRQWRRRHGALLVLRLPQARTMRQRQLVREAR